MTVNHNTQKKIALINDLSGFGRCSMTVALPIISKMKVQCCPVLTSILSNHTDFESYFFDDYTDKMSAYINEWKKIQLKFQGIASGFLGSLEQIEIVLRFIEELSFDNGETVVIVDPVMGDNGRIYATYTKPMCQGMIELAKKATILTPNLTEACILTDTLYHDGKWKMKELQVLAEKLLDLGPEKVVITGIKQGESIGNFCQEKGMEGKMLRIRKVGSTRPGTGDIFSAIIAADAVNKVPFEDSVKKASLFIKKCILKSMELEIPLSDGVAFEEVLDQLR